MNGTTHEASDVAVFQTYTFSPEWAATLLAGRHYQNPTDPDGDGWAEVPGYKRVVVQPHVYWSRSPTSSWFMTGGWTSENRRSGTFANERLPDFNRYSDDADTRRGYAGTIGKVQLDTNTLLTVRASMTREWRTRWYGDDRERDRRNEIFGDVAVTKTFDENVLTGGVALDRDQYSALDVRGESYRYTTPALYAEHTWTPDPRFAITSSARLDLQSEFGDFVSPRVSVVLRPTEAVAASSLEGKRRVRADAADRRDRGVRAVAHRARRRPPARACAGMVARRRTTRTARSSLVDRRTGPSSRTRRSCG